MHSWVDADTGRRARRRRADAPVPEALSLDAAKHRELLARWTRKDRQDAAWTTLLKEVSDAGIERAEAACEVLLRDGWIERGERLTGGAWQWQRVYWRDLRRLQRVLGVVGPEQRQAERQQALEETQAWLRQRASNAGQGVLDPDLLDEMTAAIEQLMADRMVPTETLRLRLEALRALAAWHDTGKQGLRRNFALHAVGATKAIGPADWRWLEANFDLERLRIGQFTPMLWVAGRASLHWSGGTVDLSPLHCVGMPLQDVARTERMSRAVARWWLIENRASFEQQARRLPDGVILLWLPGRPPSEWMQAVSHLLRLAPAPAWVSADADPAGVDIACGVGALWESRALAWEPYRMGLAEWESTTQTWPLNDHDRALLRRLLERVDLPGPLRKLCEAMLREGRKAEQEGWL